MFVYGVQRSNWQWRKAHSRHPATACADNRHLRRTIRPGVRHSDRSPSRVTLVATGPQSRLSRSSRDSDRRNGFVRFGHGFKTEYHKCTRIL